jgi:hypothetical protein
MKKGPAAEIEKLREGEDAGRERGASRVKEGTKEWGIPRA